MDQDQPSHPPSAAIADLMGLSRRGLAPRAEVMRTIQELEAQLTGVCRMRDTLLVLLNGTLASQGMRASIDARGALSISSSSGT